MKTEQKTTILCWLMMLLVAVAQGANTNFPVPTLTVTNWVNPVTQVHETLAWWAPTNHAPSTLYEVQHGFTNSDEGEVVSVEWVYPDMLLTRQLCVPLPCHDLRFVMILPYSPQYVFRFVPRTKPPYLFPGGPITPGPENPPDLPVVTSAQSSAPTPSETLQFFERDGTVRTLKIMTVESYLRNKSPKKREAFEKKLNSVLTKPPTKPSR